MDLDGDEDEDFLNKACDCQEPSLPIYKYIQMFIDANI
jgi:hypothetical protein